MYLICFYVPTQHAEKVKNAMFAAGAGRIGAYDSCSWETHGQGQFRPLKGSQPFIGTQNTVEKVQETKVEMVCSPNSIQNVVAALHEVHPYETPAYHIIECEDISWDPNR